MLKNFLFAKKALRLQRLLTMKSFAKRRVAEISSTVGDKKVIGGLRRWGDSSVAAVLIHQSIGKRLTCIFVTTGPAAQKKSRS